jgi:hypothetical protein
MWQNLVGHCAVFTKGSEEFAPHYLAEIRHDIRQTTGRTALQALVIDCRLCQGYKVSVMAPFEHWGWAFGKTSQKPRQYGIVTWPPVTATL